MVAVFKVREAGNAATEVELTDQSPPFSAEDVEMLGLRLGVNLEIVVTTVDTGPQFIVPYRIAEGTGIVPVSWTGTLDQITVTGATFAGDYTEFDDSDGSGGNIPLDFGAFASWPRFPSFRAPVLKLADDVPPPFPQLTANVGDTLQASNMLVLCDEGLATPVLTVRWHRLTAEDPLPSETNDVATGATYVLQAADAGATIREQREYVIPSGAGRSISARTYTIPVSALTSPTITAIGDGTATLDFAATRPAAPSAPTVTAVGDGTATLDFA